MLTAFAFKENPAEQRKQIVPFKRMLAGGTNRRALFEIHTDRNAVNEHIKEAADTNSEKEYHNAIICI